MRMPLPAQTAVLLLTATVGLMTMIWMVLDEKQPFVEVPVAVYTCVDVGFTTRLAFVLPLFQEYVAAPLAVSVLDPEGQTEYLLAAITTVGVGLTKITCCKLPMQFRELVAAIE